MLFIRRFQLFYVCCGIANFYLFLGAASDMESSTRLARAMVTMYGMSEKVTVIQHYILWFKLER